MIDKRKLYFTKVEHVLGHVVVVDLHIMIGSSQVKISPAAVVYERQLSIPSLQGQLMSCSLRATWWGL